MSDLKQSTRSIKREHWRKHVVNWLAGNISQKKYCEQHNISFASFTWWRTRGLKEKSITKKISFIPAVIKTHEPQIHANIQLIFPNQTKLVLPSNLPMNSLVAIVKSLEGLS